MIGSVDHRETTGSTNDDAKHFICDPSPAVAAPLPRLFVTDAQTAGRGRHGRRWLSGGGGLTFSLLLDAATIAADGNVSIAAAVGVWRALQTWIPAEKLSLKWPNDVLIGRQKICGILIESSVSRSHRFMIVGVGINVAGSPPAGLRISATSIMDHTESTIQCSRGEVLWAATRSLVDQIAGRSQNAADTLKLYREHCQTIGRTVRWTNEESNSCGGVAVGIAASGGLKVRTAAGETVLQSGEVREVRG